MATRRTDVRLVCRMMQIIALLVLTSVLQRPIVHRCARPELVPSYVNPASKIAMALLGMGVRSIWSPIPATVALAASNVLSIQTATLSVSPASASRSASSDMETVTGTYQMVARSFWILTPITVPLAVTPVRQDLTTSRRVLLGHVATPVCLDSQTATGSPTIGVRLHWAPTKTTVQHAE
jgi:hypothetical protein